MSQDLSERATRDRALFDDIASEYAGKDLAPGQREARRHRLIQSIRCLDLTSNPEILEVGCGAGFSAEYLAGTFSRYKGIDYSENLIAFAEHTHGGPGVEFETADLNTLREDETFDVILMIGLLHHLDDPVASLTRLSRLLRPGGWLLANEPQSGNVLISVLRSIRKQVDDAYSADQDEFSAPELLDMYQRAGLTDIRVRPQGVFSTPIAEVTLPSFVRAAAGVACRVDSYLENRFPAALKYVAWNLIACGRKPD